LSLILTLMYLSKERYQINRNVRKINATDKTTLHQQRVLAVPLLQL
jgi:hypothetical protein